jgi:hypothetical protein
MWVIRGGEQDRLVDRFVDESVIGVAHDAVPDAEILTRTEMRRFVVQGGASSDVDADVDTLSAFVNEIQEGESVLLLDLRRGEVVIGEVTGRYEFHDALEPGECRHRRPVTWLVRHDIADLPAEVQTVARQRGTLQQNRDATWAGHMAKVRAGEVGRDPKDRRAVSRSVVSPRARTRAAATPRMPKPAPVVDRPCPSCHLRKPVGQFRGDYCTDCADQFE